MDYATLRQEGIRQLERLAGKQWTDFNAHDPGITILEQLCYALTDLGYRTGFDIPDLLAEGGSDPYANLHPPEQVLTCRPVTKNDLRRLVLDVKGVKNAWIELIDDSTPPLYYNPVKNELSLLKASAPTEQVSLLGLYRVLVETTEDAGANVIANVTWRLHQNRGLCEDFAEIKELPPQLIQVNLTVEIGLVDEIAGVRRDIEQRIADVISPPVVFNSLDDLQRAGLSADQIFEGPRLCHGFITDQTLQQANRRTAINTSDLIHAVMDAAGVRAVSKIRLSTGDQKDEAWSLAVDPSQVARLDRAGSKIILTREGKSFIPETAPATQSAKLTISTSGGGLALPPGRNRNVSRYASVQNQLPALYGVGELGLPCSAPPERKAHAKQLKAYLMFFDQLMANHLAQLAHVKDLFAYGGADLRTYFTQTLDQPGLKLDELRIVDIEKKVLSKLENGDPSLENGGPSMERKSRFLNHLLARFAETLDGHSESDPTELTNLTRNKQAFLQAYPWLSGGRGTAFNYLLPAGPANQSGLAERLRLKLGLDAKSGETFLVVEHILLRPMDDDRQQQIPLLSVALHEDPYSLQLTFVFPYAAGRFPKDDSDDPSYFRGLIEQIIREETPAHLTPYIRWLAKDDFDTFKATHADWLEKRRTFVAETLKLNLAELGA